MPTKGERTRQAIIEAAKNLFAQNGYTATTMKDICTACRLSRGGLYRHFGSTKEIFISILDEDISKNLTALEQCIQRNVPARALLDAFMAQERAAIFSTNNGLYFAIHEFAFMEPDQRSYLNKRLEDALDILGTLFRYGQKTGEFKDFDIDLIANHVIYFFDSLKTSSSVLSISEELVESQMKLIKEMIV